LVSFGIAIAVIVMLSTSSGLDWDETWDNIRSINVWLYIAAVAVYYLSFLFRGYRWRVLALNATDGAGAEADMPSPLHCGRLIILGWFVNSIAWLRLGDAYRALAFSEDSKTTFPWSLGTVLAERVLDMATIAVIIFTSVFVLTATSDLAVAQYIVIMAFVMAFGVIAIILSMRVYGARVARLLPTRFETAFNRFQQGTLGSLREQLPLMLVLGLIGWLLEMGRLYLVVVALDLEIAIALVPVVALGHAILSTVPTPGGLGAVEPGITGLLLLSLNRDDAVSVAIVDRSITYASIVLIGGALFLLRNVMRARAKRTQAAVTS
tara:strand:- start:4332 stop:5297 length:966 start_codon:yes stop_codon:yes gene_type:complete